MMVRNRMILWRLSAAFLFCPVVFSVIGCDPFVRGTQIVQIRVSQANNAGPIPGALVISAPERRYGPLRDLSEDEYLSRFHEKSVRTNTDGRANVIHDVFNPGFKLQDRMTGSYYLFHVSNGKAEVLRVLMKPGEATHGEYYIITVDRIGEPTKN